MRLHDTASDRVLPVLPDDGIGRLYVCGITPYDATHLGHATTYLTFDTLHRLWLDAGLRVEYTQNITDIDDPLLERAERDGVDWRDLAASQIQLFRDDMEALRILPPTTYLGVTETVPQIADAVAALLDAGYAYRVPTPDAEVDGAEDIYFDSAATEAGTSWRLGMESRMQRPEMLELFAERGGDPDRAGKRDPLDPLLWRAARAGEPRWESPLGTGRPGWHIECSVIATQTLGPTITVQGGGRDLVFPHHEFSAAHATALSGAPFAHVFAHAGLVAYEGEKMSKSLGNLVLVSQLRKRGVDPRAIRLAILAQHYRRDWEWTEETLTTGCDRLNRWRTAASQGDGDDESGAEIVRLLRARLSDDLDTPGALDLLDEWFAREHSASRIVIDAVDALLGVRLD